MVLLSLLGFGETGGGFLAVVGRNVGLFVGVLRATGDLGAPPECTESDFGALE